METGTVTTIEVSPENLAELIMAEDLESIRKVVNQLLEELAEDE
jgi:hypothetical protein